MSLYLLRSVLYSIAMSRQLEMQVLCDEDRNLPPLTIRIATDVYQYQRLVRPIILAIFISHH